VREWLRVLVEMQKGFESAGTLIGDPFDLYDWVEPARTERIRGVVQAFGNAMRLLQHRGSCQVREAIRQLEEKVGSCRRD
jgi:hypothetical protein